jgi:16S rRNA (cytosine1402-N4)-methyltransferase
MTTDADISALHRSVLPAETMRYLAPQRGGWFVDGTLGLGGHSEAILRAAPNARVIGFDRDTEALRRATERLSPFGERFRAVHANFSELPQVAQELGLPPLAGVLADLGVSSLQLDDAQRGFSFRFDAPLDMRLDGGGAEETAAQLLARLPEEEIARVIFEYGEERRSRPIARRIVARREEGRPARTTKELADLVWGVIKPAKRDQIHPATRTFQALRIAVNRELESLEKFVPAALEHLAGDGRFVAISFHSLEDRIVKKALRRYAGQCECPPRLPVCACGAKKMIEILTRRPVTPAALESAENPRARSAKLRAARHL